MSSKGKNLNHSLGGNRKPKEEAAAAHGSAVTAGQGLKASPHLGRGSPAPSNIRSHQEGLKQRGSIPKSIKPRQHSGTSSYIALLRQASASRSAGGGVGHVLHPTDAQGIRSGTVGEETGRRVAIGTAGAKDQTMGEGVVGFPCQGTQ